MAGNEYFATRPHQVQDRTKIAAGSPLAILGLLLEGLRERFNEEDLYIQAAYADVPVF